MRRSASTPSAGGSPVGTPMAAGMSGVNMDHLAQFAQSYGSKRSSATTIRFKDLPPVKCDEERPDDATVVTFDDIDRLAIHKYRIGDRLAMRVDAVNGPMILQKGEKGTVVKGGADFRRGAIVQWDEKPEDVLGRVAPGQFAYEGHGLLPTGQKNHKIVRKEALVCAMAVLKRTESCRWPTTPIRQGKEVSMISGLPDARVKIVPGLHPKKCVSLEIALRPDHYICAFEEPPYARIIWRRTENFLKESERKEFDEQASWIVSKRDKLYVAFESMFRPGWFLAQNLGAGTITMERMQINQQFKEKTTMVITGGSEPENWMSINKVKAFAVGDDTVGVQWVPDVGHVRIWCRKPDEKEWEELETTMGYGRTSAVIRGIDFISQPMLFLVAPMHRRHFFSVALADGYDLFNLIGAKTSSEWVKHPGMDHSIGARRNALTGEEYHANTQNLISLVKEFGRNTVVEPGSGRSSRQSSPKKSEFGGASPYGRKNSGDSPKK